MDKVDLLDFLAAEEAGVLDEDEIITGFQDLIDRDLVKDLTPEYQAKVTALLNLHLCVPKGKNIYESA